MANQKYIAEFKKEAVKMALESDKTNIKIAENLGVNYKSFLIHIMHHAISESYVICR